VLRLLAGAMAAVLQTRGLPCKSTSRQGGCHGKLLADKVAAILSSVRQGGFHGKLPANKLAAVLDCLQERQRQARWLATWGEVFRFLSVLPVGSVSNPFSSYVGPGFSSLDEYRSGSRYKFTYFYPNVNKKIFFQFKYR
jgi:hypothetical protein